MAIEKIDDIIILHMYSAKIAVSSTKIAIFAKNIF
jgi:hypothetical protein